MRPDGADGCGPGAGLGNAGRDRPIQGRRTIWKRPSSPVSKRRTGGRNSISPGSCAGLRDGAAAEGERRVASMLRRLTACTIKESLELLRDPIRMGFALLGHDLSDADFRYRHFVRRGQSSFAVLDRDNSHESRTYLEELRGSRYFTEKAPIASEEDMQRRCNPAISAPRSKFRRATAATQARAARLDRRLDRWRHALPCADDPGLSDAVQQQYLPI